MYKNAIETIKEEIEDLEFAIQATGTSSTRITKRLKELETELEYLLEKEPWYE